MVYRQYEDPRELEDQLRLLRSKAEELYLEASQEGDGSPKWEEWNSLGESIADLEWRANIAWQDEEYEEDRHREELRLGEAEPEPL